MKLPFLLLLLVSVLTTFATAEAKAGKMVVPESQPPAPMGSGDQNHITTVAPPA